MKNNPFRSLFSLFDTKKPIARPKSVLLQRKYPKVYQFYTIVKNGTLQVTSETYFFFKTKFKLRNQNENPKLLNEMTWREVEIYRQIPRDWKKVAPVMIISALPLLNYIVLPIAYMYPHRLLCHQFWTLDQKLKFGEIDHLKRMALNDKLLDALLLHVDHKLSMNMSKEKYIVIDCINKVKRGEKVSVDEVLSLKPILCHQDFSLDKLNSDHVDILIHMNDCKRVFDLDPRSNLNHYAYWLKQSDKRLINHLDLRKLPITDIYKMCYDREISAKCHSINDLIALLKIWLEFSNKLFKDEQNRSDASNYTLYLHSKVLLKNFQRPSLTSERLKIENEILKN